jgi:hypothetical protein
MKTLFVTNPGFQPFTFSVTVETKEEAEMLRTLYSESQALCNTLHEETGCDRYSANDLFEALGSPAQQVLSR